MGAVSRAGGGTMGAVSRGGGTMGAVSRGGCYGCWEGVEGVVHFAPCRDPSFPRLGQMLMEYDHALRKMAEDFIPLSKVHTHAQMEECT